MYRPDLQERTGARSARPPLTGPAILYAAVAQHAHEQRPSGVRYRSQPDRSRSVNLTVPVVQLSEPLLARKPIVSVAFAVLRVVK
jgi:hypothetical protein